MIFINYQSNGYYNEIREYLDEIPVLETHEHYTGIIEPVPDVLNFTVSNYYRSDFTASDPEAEKNTDLLNDKSIPFDRRYEVFKKFYDKSKHTAYARAVVKGLKECWDVDFPSKNSFFELEEKFKNRDQSFYNCVMKKHNIKGKICNVEIADFVLNKSDSYSELCKFALNLPKYHNLHSIADVKKPELSGQVIRSLDDYTDAFEKYLLKCLEFGIVCMKDQTAYRREISYENFTKADAEKVFNKIISSPREVFGTGEVRPLDDWLFRKFMSLAAKYKIPVQIHTGHMAGIRNEISKTNAVHLISLIEMYPDVVFDLFHGNWPYMGELLFLGKNYPNVILDLCWVQSIDPLYSIELMKRALVTVPSSKLLAFGGDTTQPEWTIGYLMMAKDNTARALADMCGCGWLNISDARQIASDWFFNNVSNVFNIKI